MTIHTRFAFLKAFHTSVCTFSKPAADPLAGPGLALVILPARFTVTTLEAVLALPPWTLCTFPVFACTGGTFVEGRTLLTFLLRRREALLPSEPSSRDALILPAVFGNALALVRTGCALRKEASLHGCAVVIHALMVPTLVRDALAVLVTLVALLLEASVHRIHVPINTAELPALLSRTLPCFRARRAFGTLEAVCASAAWPVGTLLP